MENREKERLKSEFKPLHDNVETLSKEIKELKIVVE